MRGYKAKVFRRIALSIEKDNSAGYVYPKGRRHQKVMVDAMGALHPYYVSGQAVLASKAHRLYKAMKKETRRGGQ